ncbi:MAG TPA: type II secretion system protein [Gammaproteobacteria bacterium]|nr:type II secretion system protein [Gammaproteobacteria bacterium]
MRESQRGLTLIELVSSILILIIAVGGVMLAVNTTVSRSADPMIEEQAAAIAQSYLEEVLLKPFCDPDVTSNCPTACTASACSSASCSAAEGSRALYDDVCDYNGLNDNGARDQNGTAIIGLGNYTINVTVASAGVTFNGLNSNNGQVVRVDVKVTHPALTGARTVTGYKTNY